MLVPERGAAAKGNSNNNKRQLGLEQLAIIAQLQDGERAPQPLKTTSGNSADRC